MMIHTLELLGMFNGSHTYVLCHYFSVVAQNTSKVKIFEVNGQGMKMLPKPRTLNVKRKMFSRINTALDTNAAELKYRDAVIQIQFIRLRVVWSSQAPLFMEPRKHI